MKIIKNRQNKPLCVLGYGPKGLGKTSLAAQFPNPILIDIEKGAAYVDIDQWPCDTYLDVVEALKKLVDSEYQTIAIDSLDWLEALAKDFIKEKYKTDSFEKAAGGYGKSYIELLDLNRAVKDILEKARQRGKHIYLIAHPRKVSENNPMVETTFDRFEVKLQDSKNVSVKDFWTEYVDFLFFLNKDIYTVGKGKEARAEDSGTYLFTKNCAAYDAKSRVKMPEKIKFEEKGMFEVISSFFKNNTLPKDDANADDLFAYVLSLAEACQDQEVRKYTLSVLPKYKTDATKLKEIQAYIEGKK